MTFREIVPGGKTEELRLILFCSTNAMLLTGVALTSEILEERVASHNFKGVSEDNNCIISEQIKRAL